METIKKIKPVHYYVFGGFLGFVGSTFKNDPITHYSFLFLGIGFILLGIIKYFREKN